MTRPVCALILALVAPIALAGPPPPYGPPGLGPPPRFGEGPEPGMPPPHVVDEIRAREAEILAWLKTADPEGHQRLLELKQTDPRAFVGGLVRAARLKDRAEDDPGVVARHQRMQELEQAIQERANTWKTQSAEARKKARPEIERLASELFEIRQQERRAHVAELQRRLEELEAEIEEREADRKSLIDAYLDQVLEGPVDL